MAQPLRTILVPSQALAATSETFTYDLPVNPLSVILITLRCYNNTLTATNYTASAREVMSKLANVRVRYRGATILDGDPFDLVQVYGRYSGWWPSQMQVVDADNYVRSITFPLMFGRRAFDTQECFPASRRGDLVLEINTGDDLPGLDSYDMQIGTIELLDATPARFIKVTTTQFAMTSGDVNDISLPIGNRILGLLLRGATYPDTNSSNSSFSECALEVDNVEAIYSRWYWPMLHAEWRMRTALDWMMMAHNHRSNLAATYTQNEYTLQGQYDQAETQRYGWAEFDPLNDLSMALDTRGAADINWHVNSDVTDTSTSRILPVEYIEVAGATTGGA